MWTVGRYRNMYEGKGVCEQLLKLEIYGKSWAYLYYLSEAEEGQTWRLEGLFCQVAGARGNGTK